MNATALLLLSSAMALATSLLPRADRVTHVHAPVPAWPTHFQGQPLLAVALSTAERTMLGGFPGAVARFSDGERDIVMRWVTQATRQLHPAADCYQGLGYDVQAARVLLDGDGAQWRCFTATRGAAMREVCEQLKDREGQRWTDVSSWYWAAVLGRTEGPWLVTTVAGAAPRK
jgi:hypothetical protein